VNNIHSKELITSLPLCQLHLDIVCKFITLSFDGLLMLIGDDCSVSALIAIVQFNWGMQS
jgi:hypothetical protein